MLPARVRSKAADTGREKRARCPAHLAFVRSHHCVVPGCDAMPIEAMHIRVGTICGMGQKPDDDKSVSGCRDHHAELHRIGERSFAAKYGLDLLKLAAEFAKASPAWKRHLAKKEREHV